MGRADRKSSFDQPRRAQQARLRLRRHVDTPSAVTAVTAQVARFGDGRVTIAYEVDGGADLVWPAAVASDRAERLWEHTCFELFVKMPAREDYLEFNFSPSTQWAAYRFSAYRQAMQLARGMATPTLRPRPGALAVSLDLTATPGLPVEEDWLVGLSAVIEEKRGKSYWALKHPPGKPDFHHQDCFALILAAPLGA